MFSFRVSSFNWQLFIPVIAVATISPRVFASEDDLIGTWHTHRIVLTENVTEEQSVALSVVEQIAPGQYRVVASATNKQYLPQGKHWTGGPCAGSSRKFQNPCVWESSSNGILIINGTSVRIKYESNDWSPDDLKLRGNTMEGRDGAGPVRFLRN